MTEAGDLGVEAGAAFLEGVVDEDAGSDLEGGELEALSADGRAGHGENGVDADGAHESALAGHVGAADEEGAGFAGDVDVVADAFGGGDEGMAEGFGFERRRGRHGVGHEVREWIGWMLEVVGGEGEESFYFADGRQPAEDGFAVGGAPGFGGIGDLDGVHEGKVEELHDGVVEGVDVLDDCLEFGDGFGAGDVMGGEVLLEGLQAGSVEGFGFEAG